MYNVTFTKQALKQLKKLDKFTQSTIYQWIVNNLDGTDNPRLHGKGLTANHSGQWRYRVGDYRVLANIIDDEIVIEIFTIGHRRDIY
ncbi:MAG: type II toxin-antitoxin system RelE/ParE family toxin [Leuconostoc gelidum]|jgi:mRNA interferase RelE/StbE|nr:MULTISPECIES: type II toxin-antitoxin system RelE/ParE family toxin [Leuconostoc gelidum group]MBZ5947941.1 type II toxin-antitoxin system RelE/ParE family toxin [Leuconostoc gasicomitatum]MBZ6001211.1 type II toxin-antitoxin system RelE/ParE family toxin [Leuconostoc gelidum subsp. gelidum]MBZ6009773.1 type II toxin-antitoxin system RelE/ParE family toxin [Leuconostoc gelidum subsp. aenigmaticum]